MTAQKNSNPRDLDDDNKATDVAKVIIGTDQLYDPSAVDTGVDGLRQPPEDETASELVDRYLFPTKSKT